MQGSANQNESAGRVMNRPGIQGAIVALILLSSFAVRAQETRAPEEVEAENEFRAGEEAYAAERWQTAADHFARAHQLLSSMTPPHSRRGLVAYNTGRAL